MRQRVKEWDNEREGEEGGKLPGGFSLAIVYVKYQVRCPFERNK